ncbi:MAG: ABC transporter substrate-binding protein [Planctomycetota bacterium]
MSRTPLLLAATASLALLSSGCPAPQGKGIARVDQSSLVEVITADDAKVLDPHTTSDGGNVKLITQLYQTLVRVNPADTTRLEPELAESWAVAEDGRSIRFKVRANVTFHDGAALDAAAVKLSLDRLCERGFKLRQNPYGPMFAEVAEVTASGQELVIKLTAPVALMMLKNLSMFSASIVSPKLLEATKAMSPDDAETHVTKHAAGTGPYKLDAFDPNANIKRLVAYEGYWGGKPAIQTLVFKQVPDEATRRQNLTQAKGVVFLDDVPRQDWDAVEKSQDMQLKSWWSPNLCYLGVSATHEKTKELPLRQAIALAVDRAAFLPHYDHHARDTYSLVAQTMAEYDPELRCTGWVPDRAQRLAKARELVKQAGAEGRELTVYYPKEPRPYLPKPDQIADTLRQQLAEIGIAIKIQAVQKAVLFPEIETGKYELVLIGWTGDNGDADNFYAPLADGEDGKPNSNNVSRVVDPEAHQKIVAAREITDPARRTQAYREIERLLQDRVAGYVPLVNTQTAVAFSKQLQGVEVDLLSHYRFHKATLKQP